MLNRKIFLFVALGFLSLIFVPFIFHPTKTGEITKFTRTEETTTTNPKLESTTTSTTQKTTVTSKTSTTLEETTSTTTTTIPSTDHVVFSEVLYDTPGTETAEEWIELYNPTSDAVDLSGLTIEDNKDSYPFPNGTMIADKEYLVIARNEIGFENLYGFLPDLSDLNLKLANGGDELRLKDGSEEIDMVTWGDNNFGWSLEADEGESIQRNPLYKDTDIDDDWIINSDPDPEPGGLIISITTTTSTTTTITTTTTTSSTSTTETTTSTTVTTTSTTTTMEESTTTTTISTTTTVPLTQNVVINEVLYDPNDTDTGKEWVELKNTGTNPITITGYDLNAVSGDYYTFPILSVPSNSFVIVHWRRNGTDDTDFSDNVAHLYTGTIGFDYNMGNSKGWVALFNSSTHSSSYIIDYIEYGEGDQTWESAAVSAGIWTVNEFIPDVEERHSIARYTLGYDTNSPDDFYDDISPSPGQQNE